jgi:hypothetical protein
MLNLCQALAGWQALGVLGTRDASFFAVGSEIHLKPFAADGNENHGDLLL